MPLYLDACAVVKRYVDEGDGGTAVMDAIFADPSRWGGLSSSEWLLAEVTAALAKKYREAAFGGRQFLELWTEFRSDTAAVIDLVDVEPGYVEGAALLLANSPGIRFHPGDALHLYTAEALRSELTHDVPLVFVTADGGLARVARAAGLAVFDPGAEPIEALAGLFPSDAE